MIEFEGRHAFITGAASGIGRAIAERLGREGMAVTVADIDGEAAARACAELEAEGLRAFAVECDVTDEARIAQAADLAYDAIGPVDLLVNNAGAFTALPLEETVRRDWEWLIEINVIGVVNGIQTFLPRMRERGEPAHILNTASVSGHLAVPGLSIYTATKFAVVGLSECLRIELDESPIGVSILCPGIVRTGLLDSSRSHRPDRHGGTEAARPATFSDVIEAGSDPANLAEQVVKGLRAGDFYIFTHPEMQPPIEARLKEILAAQPSAP